MRKAPYAMQLQRKRQLVIPRFLDAAFQCRSHPIYSPGGNNTRRLDGTVKYPWPGAISLIVYGRIECNSCNDNNCNNDNEWHGPRLAPDVHPGFFKGLRARRGAAIPKGRGCGLWCKGGDAVRSLHSGYRRGLGIGHVQHVHTSSPRPHRGSVSE